MNKIISNSYFGLVCIYALFISDSIVQAQGERLHINGFVSQGYLMSTENNYPIANSINGSSEFNEVAINLYTLPSDILRLGIQLLGRDMGNEGNNSVYVDWAYGDYHWRDYLGLRFGKIKMPNGFYNSTRDLDMLRTNIFMPQSVYTSQWRDFTLAVEGMSLYGNGTDKHLGEIDYEIYGGSLV